MCAQLYADRVNQEINRTSKPRCFIGSYDDSPSEEHFISQYRNLLHHYYHQLGAKSTFTFWGACGVIHRDIFNDAGGFNEKYTKASIEDVEFGYRLRDLGYDISLRKDIQVKHLKKWDLALLLKTDYFNRAKPWTLLLRQTKVLPKDLNFRWVDRVSVVICCALLLMLLPVFLGAWSVLLLPLMMTVFLVINLRVYRFFAEKKGGWFAFKAIPFHFAYFLICGLGYSVGSTEFLIKSTLSIQS